ncbi:MAG TPA: SDR family oxidoreductase [Caulobacter sp.]|nr:SDR family oxidoreductase [Caulobacter sp.]
MATASANGRKSIFITGAASGIGLGAAKRFAREGWFVGLADIDKPGLKAALQAIGPGNGVTIDLDVRDRGQWTRALAAFAKASGGRLDVLLNNAGIARYGYLEEQSPDEGDLQIDINVKGVINGARAGLELLKATPGSTLINVASCAGLFGSPRMAIYSATKFAVRGLSESLEAEFGRFGIAVRCIMPWFVDTPILNAGAQGSNLKITDAIREGGSPVYTVEEAAQVIWESAQGRGGKLNYIVGKAGKDMAFMLRFMPGAVRKRLKALAAAE